MTTTLAQGANAPLLKVDGASVITVTTSHKGTDADLSGLSLNSANKVPNEAAFVFYGNPASPESPGTAYLGKSGDGATAPIIQSFTIEPGKLSMDVVKIALALTLDPATAAFSSVKDLKVTVAVDGVEVVSFTPVGTAENAFVIAEVYRRNGDWKVRHVGQGYTTGLAGIATDFGVEIGKDEAPAAQAAPVPDTFKQPEAAAAPPPPAGISFVKGAAHSLKKKGDSAAFEKTAEIVATISWRPDKDYDVAADVLYDDGTTDTIVTYGTEEGGRLDFTMSTLDKSVEHMGDVGVGAGGKQEILKIRLTGASAGKKIVAIVVWAYSARRNLGGSFKRYQVTFRIDNGAGGVIQMLPQDLSNNDGVFTMVPAIVYNHPWGVEVKKVEEYSEGGEHRPAPRLLPDGTVELNMDQGKTNIYKD